MIHTGAKGVDIKDMPLDVTLAGLNSLLADFDVESMHKIIGGLHRQAQEEQVAKAQAGN